MFVLLILQIIFAFLFSSASPLTHDLKWGSCPKVTPKSDFKYEGILGMWYVIQRTQTSSTCVTYNFRLFDDGNMDVKETAKPFSISIPYVMERFSQTGTLKVPDSSVPAKMRVTFTFTLIPFTAFDFTVIDTDYTNYLATFSCRKLLGTHSQAAMILSRTPTLDTETIDKLRDRFEYFSINSRRMTYVDQKSCGHEEILNTTELEPETSTSPPLTTTTLRTTTTTEQTTATTESTTTSTTTEPTTSTTTESTTMTATEATTPSTTTEPATVPVEITTRTEEPRTFPPAKEDDGFNEISDG